MRKKIRIVTLVMLSSLIFLPFTTTYAEQFIYSVSVEQPALAVSIVSTATTYDIQTIIDRANPIINLDTYITENTGNVDAYIEARALLTSKDGSQVPSLGPNTSFPTRAGTAYLVLTDEATQTPIRGIQNSDTRVYDILQGQSKRTVLDFKLHPDFSSAIDIQVDFTAKPI